MEPSGKSHAFELNWVDFGGAMPDNVTESVGARSSRLQP